MLNIFKILTKLRSLINGNLKKPENTDNETKFRSYPQKLTAILFKKRLELTINETA